MRSHWPFGNPGPKAATGIHQWASPIFGYLRELISTSFAAVFRFLEGAKSRRWNLQL
jgi:hypothetical protein